MGKYKNIKVFCGNYATKGRGRSLNYGSQYKQKATNFWKNMGSVLKILLVWGSNNHIVIILYNYAHQ